MKPVIPKPQRCAIYTRKSTEHNVNAGELLRIPPSWAAFSIL
jgi:hypothetical protein